MFKEKGRKKQKADAGVTAADLIESLSADEEDEDVEVEEEDEVKIGSATFRRPRTLKASSQEVNNDFRDIDDEVSLDDPMPLDDRAMVTMSPGIANGIVDDSDWDGAEVLD